MPKYNPDFVYDPERGKERMLCPVCEHLLPISRRGGCDECGTRYKITLEYWATPEEEDTNE